MLSNEEELPIVLSRRRIVYMKDGELYYIFNKQKRIKKGPGKGSKVSVVRKYPYSIKPLSFGKHRFPLI